VSNINPITTEDKNSFAYYTLINRLPKIIQSVIDDNDFDDEIIENINSLLETLPEGQLSPLGLENRENRAISRELKEKHYNWNKAPFLFIENYLYHKLSEITDFKHLHHDYFAKRKTDGVLKGLPKMITMLSEYKRISELDMNESLEQILLLNLLGNKADLSQSGDYYIRESVNNNLLIDHISKLDEIINSAERIDFVLDNAGEELYSDLLLAYWLLEKTPVVKVNLHFKTMPYFVSDALISDFDILLNALSEELDFSVFVSSIKAFIDNGHICLCSHSFWSSGQLYNELPDELLNDFKKSDLMIFKGDLNYRKLVGDLKWNHNHKTESIVNYLPATALIIRILKSEVVVGVDTVKIPQTDDTSWMYNGNYGILEVCDSTVKEG
jgi:damage-control phosphatase, subfamily III